MRSQYKISSFLKYFIHQKDKLYVRNFLWAARYIYHMLCPRYCVPYCLKTQAKICYRYCFAKPHQNSGIVTLRDYYCVRHAMCHTAMLYCTIWSGLPSKANMSKSIVHCHISLACCMQYSCFWRQGLVLCCIFPLLQYFSFAILLPGRNVVIDGRMLPQTDVKGIIIGQLVVN